MAIGTYLVAVCSLALIAVVVFRVPVRRDYRRQGRLSVLSSSLQIVVFGLLMTLTWMSSRSPWPDPHVGLVPSTIAWCLLGLGCVVTVIAMARLGLPRSLGRGAAQLAQAGPYGTSRNPQIVGFGAMALAYALLSGTWYTLGIVLVYALVAHLMVVAEEEHLLRTHGERYRQYLRQVPRYVGWRRPIRERES